MEGENLSRSPEGPARLADGDDPTRAQRLVGAMCEDLGVPFLDLGVPFLNDVHDAVAGRGRSLYVPVDGHFNDAGRTLLAESLDRFVVANLPSANQIALPDIER